MPNPDLDPDPGAEPGPPPADEMPRVRGTLWLLPLGALLLIPALVVRGSSVDPAVAPGAFAAWALSAGFVPGAAATLVAAVLLLFGFLALAVHLRGTAGDGPAMVGFVLFVVAFAAFLPWLGVLALGGPSLANDWLAGDIGALAPLTGGLATGALALGSLAFLAAGVAYALAVRRSETLPMWTAAVLLVQAPLLAYGSTVSVLAEVLGAVLLLAAGVGIAAEVAFEHRIAVGLPVGRARGGVA